MDVHYDSLTKKPTVTGFCIDVFKAAISGLPYKVAYVFIPYISQLMMTLFTRSISRYVDSEIQ